MRKILMRAVLSPLANKSAVEVISQNLIGNNMGNMIFANSMYRTLMTEDTQIDTIATNRRYSQEELDKMNEEYECFIIPLANAFRASFRTELGHLTALVKGLKMPCIIAGVGVQAKIESTMQREFSFDKEAKEFINAVLEKSSIIGLRGDTTAEYMAKLGYKEEKDYTIIGCPSMYMFGKNLPIPRQSTLTGDSPVSINYKIDLPDGLHAFIEESKKLLPNYTCIPQSIEELQLMYAGLPYPLGKHKKVPETYPVSLSCDVYRNDKVRGFVNVPSWLEFLRGVDFSFGSRIHGNIAAVLAGTPCYIFVYDARILELARYHNIPHMLAKDIKPGMNILNIYESTDFSLIQKGHNERFAHFLDFLNKNEIKHIYDENGDASSVPFEEKMNALPLEPAVHSFSFVPLEEQEKRLTEYYTYLNKKINGLKKENERLKKAEKILPFVTKPTWTEKLITKFRNKK